MAVFLERKIFASFEEVKIFLREVHEHIDTRTPFTSLAWQESWAYSLKLFPSLYIFKLENQPIGYCWIASKKTLHFPPIHSWYLNQSGIINEDQVWIEYNTLICSKKHEQACLISLLEEANRSHVCKLYISMANDISISKEIIENTLGIKAETINGYRTSMFTPDLEKQFSKNTRSQIRRSTRLLEDQYGSISVNEASETQRHIFLDNLGALHKEKWSDSTEGSGFENPSFLAHHTYFLENFSEYVSIAEVKAGTTLLGYTYNFVFGDTVYFYCSGINYQFANNKIKPGYTLHFTLMEYYRKQGFHWYDFLGGESRYKESLCTQVYAFTNLTFYTKSTGGRLARLLQRLKQRLS
ncbi:GNAT family N-acetyltransferase [Alteromonas sp. KUL150]|mgnify:CR=1 FL=1|uniref:GNAT family N-acetyltransferase n=1 Tax=unclassified Alteromonas TaxID=2614992 RepID=UPI0012E5A15D|nr:GNAT family N-acetyltransferase [Alteromonas sp. KUL150]GFD86945.1 hypothetical protein KUL150_30040 [Alteromonas sp. KUL150]